MFPCPRGVTLNGHHCKTVIVLVWSYISCPDILSNLYGLLAAFLLHNYKVESSGLAGGNTFSNWGLSGSWSSGRWWPSELRYSRKYPEIRAKITPPNHARISVKSSESGIKYISPSPLIDTLTIEYVRARWVHTTLHIPATEWMSLRMLILNSLFTRLTTGSGICKVQYKLCASLTVIELINVMSGQSHTEGIRRRIRNS